MFESSNIISVIEPLALSSSSPKVNQQVTARFTIRNETAQALTIELTAGARRGANWSGEQVDFPHKNVTIKPGEVYSYNEARSFSTVGAYFAEPVAKVNGNWGGVLGANRVSFSVYSQNETPPTTPVPTPRPSTQGVTVMSAWPQGSMGAQGQEFRPEVVVQTSGFSLDCGKSFLENRDGNRYRAHPIQGCTPLGENQYRIAFGTPMRAPDSPGEYHSRWQIWNGSAHIGPEIDLWFRVARPPAANRPPGNPTLERPGDLHEERSTTAPELCWSPVSDPDGEPVRYYAEVFESANLDNSGWITGTCWRPHNLDGKYFSYQWRVKARDSRDAESGWSERRRFTLSPPVYDPVQPTSTSQILPTQPPKPGSWWDTTYSYRRLMPISANGPQAAGTLIKVDGLDLSTLVAQGKARQDRNDLRVVRQLSDTTWQEVARAVYSDWDVEFRLLSDLPAGVDNSYYLYYGNSSAAAPPTFSLPQGWWFDVYQDKWWSSYVGTWEHDQAMDFGDVCEPPLSHRSRASGSSFDDSDKFRGRLFVPSTGRWTFKVYTNDGYALYLDGQEIGHFDGYETNRWATIGSRELKAGWYTFELRNMWVNCGAWKFAMEGPGFNQIVPASYFQKVWGNVRGGISPGFEETQAAPVTPTHTSTPTLTSTPVAPQAPSFAGDGGDGNLTVSTGEVVVPNNVRVAVNASGTTAMTANSNGFAEGDIVLFHQSQGTANVGRWELARIASIVSDTSWELAQPLTYAYDSVSGRAQAIRVPQYRYLTVNAGGTLAAPPWDGSTGGFLALMCNGVCTIAGNVNLSEMGFRGGAPYNIANTAQYQGEGSAGIGRRLQAANGNGGGGGHSEYPVQAWTGGAGGGNGAPGGNAGGRNGSPTSFGGASVGAADLSVAVFGGGGGGYTQETGGNGGGNGFLFVNALTLSGSVAANGRDGRPQGGESSGSGGGAGGSVLIRANNIDSNGVVTAFGGAGGPSGSQYGTPGGAGGTGLIRVEYCTSFSGIVPGGASVQQIGCSDPTLSPTPTSTAIPGTTPTSTPTATPVPPLWWLGDGRDGAMPASGNLDANNGVGLGSVSGSAGSTTISVEDRYAVWRINPGDYVLFHQTRGTNAGYWELARAASDITGSGSFSLVSPLQRTYTTSGFQNRAQIVRVPQYATCNVTGTITPLMAWNGDVGGIVAIMCQGSLQVSGAIRADGAGFRGGDSGNGYATDQWQGEGILCVRNSAEHYCKSPDRFASDQGGGAADAIGGGGGGGGYTSGSDGDHVGGSSWGAGGGGYGAPDGSTRFFGGGGGGGATSINLGTGTSQAGSGGGLIYLFAESLSVSGQISVQGQQATGIMYDDGLNRRVTAGSGGGGQVFIRVRSAGLGTNQIIAQGAPQLVPPAGGTGRFGGGAGGNGHVRIEYCESLSGSTSSPSDAQQITCLPSP